MVVRRNLVDVLGTTLRLYAPLFGELLDGFPRVHEIRMSGLRGAAVVQSYDAESLSCNSIAVGKASGPRMEYLSRAVSALLDSCPPLRGTEKLLSLTASRDGEGGSLRAILTCGICRALPASR
jgi:hypothetical protein